VVLGEAVKAVYLSGEGSDGVLSEDLSLALNGSLVALVEVDNLDLETPVYDQNRSLPSLDEVNFLGFGIVRAISPAASANHRGTKVHLLTPLSAEMLGRVNAIVKNGAMEVPTAGMLDWRDRGEEGAGGVLGVPWGEVPFFDTGVGGVGVERRRWRRNLMRKGM
jgi:polynucleotide 5'-hydroxyl-kinase GRC3/NOL9